MPQELSSQMHDYISTATPQEIAALLNAISATQSQSPETHQAQNMALKHERPTKPPQRNRAAGKGKPQGVKKQRAPSARSPRSSKQATDPEDTVMRPLNSFFAFRSE